MVWNDEISVLNVVLAESKALRSPLTVFFFYDQGLRSETSQQVNLIDPIGIC